MLISQITSSSSASGYYSSQTPTQSNLNQAERQPASPVTSPSLTRISLRPDMERADPLSFATQHSKPIPRSVDLYDVRILGDATAQDDKLQRVPQVAVSWPPKMQSMVQQPRQQPMQQLAPPREPTVSAKEQAFIDQWK